MGTFPAEVHQHEVPRAIPRGTSLFKIAVSTVLKKKELNLIYSSLKQLTAMPDRLIDHLSLL